LTYDDEEIGGRVSRGWQVPRSKEDLIQRRRVNKYTAHHMMGVFGRPPDYGPLVPIGYLSIADELEALDPAGLQNVHRFVRWGKENNILSADVIADVQSDRRIPISQKPGRLRVVKQTSEGKVLYGAKPCVSVAAQGHVGTIVTALTPGADPDAAIFCWVPVNAKGITLVSREGVAREGSTIDHPLDSRGEESDTMMLFDHVLIPHENFFSFGRQEMLPIYYKKGGLGLWHILSRLVYKAEIFAGTGQIISEVLGTTSIAQVRDSISELTRYATTLKAFVLAAEDTAEMRNGVCIPNEEFVTAGRLHSITEYPKILQILRELSGQGLISRFSDAAFEQEDVRQMMAEFLPGTGVDAAAKNRLFNFVWDLTCGSNALRVSLFENVNSTPPAAIRARIYNSPYRQPWRDFVADFLALQVETD
jgi:aromatic ring hydroxylase